jgi:alkylation response protein AidB-like acyl-CoA dehydrogenase
MIAATLAAAVARVLGEPDPEPGTAVVWNAVTTGDPADAGIEASAVGRSWQLEGSVTTVLVPPDVSTLLVVSRSRPQGGRDRGMRVHHLRIGVPGVHLQPRALLGADAVTIRFDGAQVTDDDAMGPPRDASAALAVAFDEMLVPIVADMLSAADAALDVAVEWTSSRVQFGAPLASRQAVQHRAADMAIACTAVRALLDDARTRALAAPASLEAVIAKLIASERLPAVTAAAHQLHGGEGYYADRPLADLHRRVLTLAGLFGDATAQRRRLAALLA